MKKNELPRKKLSFGQKLSDYMARFFGSWHFILILMAFISIWILTNVYALLFYTWDPYPFILLNLILSSLAAIQVPLILMSQNITSEKDRSKAERDFAVNRATEREVENIQKDLDEIKRLVNSLKTKTRKKK